MRKRLPHFTILHVVSNIVGDPYLRTMLQEISPTSISNYLDANGDMKQGFFCASDTDIYLPKRRKGETFEVTRTQVDQVTL
jgi:hypothetical protein